MVNVAWIFVIATAIAVFGILFSFKKLMSNVQSKLEKEPGITIQTLQQDQTRFFIHVAISEAIPILLLVYGFTQISMLQEPVNIFVPLLCIIIIYVIALINVLRIRSDALGYGESTPESKNMVNMLIFIGLALLSAIPMISVIALFTMPS